jgi:hypothetical protein
MSDVSGVLFVFGGMAFMVWVYYAKVAPHIRSYPYAIRKFIAFCLAMLPYAIFSIIKSR